MLNFTKFTGAARGRRGRQSRAWLIDEIEISRYNDEFGIKGSNNDGIKFKIGENSDPAEDNDFNLVAESDDGWTVQKDDESVEIKCDIAKTSVSQSRSQIQDSDLETNQSSITRDPTSLTYTVISENTSNTISTTALPQRKRRFSRNTTVQSRASKTSGGIRRVSAQESNNSWSAQGGATVDYLMEE